MKQHKEFERKNKISFNYHKIIGNIARNGILELCKEPKNATKLQKKLGISTGSLYHHLKILEKEGLIIKKYLTDGKGKKLRGRETIIKTNQKKLRELINKERKKEEKELNDFSKELKIYEQVEIKKDPKLFKIIFTPLELFTLKILIKKIHPLNIRDIYTQSVTFIFLFTFEKDNNYLINTSLLNNLLNAGYGSGLVNLKERKKAMKTFFSIDRSETEMIEEQYSLLREHKIKVPSYDKFQNIFKSFERNGTIYKRARQGKSILYGLNPKFYNTFKDSFRDILRL